MLYQTHLSLLVDAFDQRRANSDGEHQRLEDEGGEQHCHPPKSLRFLLRGYFDPAGRVTAGQVTAAWDRWQPQRREATRQ